jgi:type VI secretion system protein ImpG
VGHGNHEALLPVSLRAFSGYRLLQEAAALPQRLLFFEVRDLAERLKHAPPGDLELLILFSRGDASLETKVHATSLALNCTPAINLFAKKLDRIQLGTDTWQYHVVPDQSRPMDFEVHSLVSVQGFGVGRLAQQSFLPLYASTHASADDAAVAGSTPPARQAAHGYFTVRREPRKPSKQQRPNEQRIAYMGEELFIALVDPKHAPYSEDVRQLSIQALVTNRDLPSLLPQAASPVASAPAGARVNGAAAGPVLWKLDASGPVKRADVLRGPTRPVSRRPVGEIGWQLVSHLTLNHLSLIGADPLANAAALRTMLLLYGAPDDSTWQNMVGGIQRLEARSVTRRLPGNGPLCFGTGVALTLVLDELACQGTSAYFFASVLEVFFARHAAINSFSQLTLRTIQRSEVMRWPPRIGLREDL